MLNPGRLLPGLALLLPLVGAPSAAAEENGAESTVRVLQMNLCNSGFAGCWAGKPGDDARKAERTIARAVEEILRVKPQVVTLNEICSDDLKGLKERIRFQGDSFFKVYKGDDPYRCGGKRGGGGIYGSAILTREPLRKPYSTYRFERVLTVQYDRKERRVMGCRKMPWGTVCTAHTNQIKDDDYRKRLTVTGAQCREVMREARRFAGTGPIIVAGDLNLDGDKSDQRAKLDECTAGYASRSDGGVQHVITTKRFAGTGSTDMSPWTDHDSFWANLQ
ncbi:endonuclease/exonuclease/phosphatase family protein [Nonomuraea typhae]|uniref:Endonuclease/exonuclease/phosphatase family protein n=1 Tax=Nonomuraea typhae TaxID=2603600 RepID=A0ABW7YUH4_9ACTN